MPRTVDFTRVAPPQAVCCACSRQVMLDRRARRLGKFRCPSCRTDNRVGPDGLGTPLGAAEQLEAMPQARCFRCGSTNRLPRAILRAGRYTCFHCGSVEPVPRPLRRRAGIVSPLLIGGVLLFTVLSVAWSWAVVHDAVVRYVALVTPRGPTVRYEVESNVQLHEARPLAADPTGNRYEADVGVFNPFDQPLTFHVRAQLVNRDQPGASRTVTVRKIESGAWRRLRIVVIDRQRRPVTGIRVDLVGVS